MLNLVATMNDIAFALDKIPDLKVYEWPTESISPPACVVGYPEIVNYDQTYDRGSDRATFPIFLCVGHPYSRSARENLDKFMIPVKIALDDFNVDAGSITSASIQSSRGTQVRIEVISIARVDYLTAIFDMDIIA